MDLANKTCEPCRGGMPPMTPEAAKEMLTQLGAGWTVNDQGHLERDFSFPDFATAMAFANRVGDVAEQEGHHPLLHVTWGSVLVEYWTHTIGGLHEADFIMAAKTDRSAGPE